MSSKVERTIEKTLFVLFFCFSLFFILFPVIWVLKVSFAANLTEAATFSLPNLRYWDNYKAAFNQVDIPRVFWNTVQICFFTVGTETLIATLASFAITKIDVGKWNDRFYAFFVAGMVVPGFIMLFPGYKMSMWMGINGSYLALILMYVGNSIPFAALMMTGAFRDFPKEIEEAARIDGCNYLRSLVSVMLPCVKATIATYVIFNFLGTYNDYMTASIMINEGKRQTLSLSVYAFRNVYNTNRNATAAYVVLILIPPLILYLFLQKYIIDGVTAGAVKG